MAIRRVEVNLKEEILEILKKREKRGSLEFRHLLEWLEHAKIEYEDEEMDKAINELFIKNKIAFKDFTVCYSGGRRREYYRGNKKVLSIREIILLEQEDAKDGV